MTWILILFAAGIALILAEFFVPGGICGAFGGVSLLVSAGMAIYHYPDYAIFIVVGEFIAALISVVLGLYLFPHTFAGKRMILQSDQPSDEGWVASTSDDTLIGQEGRAFTTLRPAGTVAFAGRRVGAVTSGEFIEQGSRVRVIEVRGNRIVVEAAGEE